MLCLAIDIGASSGRHILGKMENGKIVTEEIYRFQNGFENQNGTLAWNLEHLLSEVLAGIRRCSEIGKIPETVAIDTWGVDYVLLDHRGCELLPAVAYRDSRTEGVPEETEAIISREELFGSTGIQPINFNTIYQLFCDAKSGKLRRAEHFLMIPEYLSYKLTGAMKNEYTNATTGSIIHAKTGQRDISLLEKLGIKTDIFEELLTPGSTVGRFNKETADFVGFSSTVVFCGSHDTASAVAACPIEEDGMYISSGTWSLIGTENVNPILSVDALSGGFTNEGGVNGRFRFLKNIMGMWLFQNLKKDLGNKYTYDDMMHMAMQSSYRRLIDPNAQEFVAPDHMLGAIRGYLQEPDLPVQDVLSSVYHSLAASYRAAVETVERISGKTVSMINIIGGGSKDRYLNRLTAQYTGKKVLAGPVEATALGNLIVQFMALEPSCRLEDMRAMIKNSFDITEV